MVNDGYDRLVPQGAAFPTSPSEADVFYRTSDHKLYVYNGTAWINAGPYYQ